MIEDTIDLLDRAWSYLDSQTGFDFVAHVFTFFEDLRRDPRTRAILDDLQREERESAAELERAKAAARAALVPVLDVLERDHGETFAAPSPDYDCSARGVRVMLSVPVPSTDEAEDDGPVVALDSDRRVDRAIAILLGQTHAAQLTELRDTIDAIKLRLVHARRSRKLAWVAGPGASLTLMLQHLADLHPAAEKASWRVELARCARIRRTALGNLQAAVFDGAGITDDVDTEPQVTKMLQDMRHDTRRVYEEVRRRLGAERSVRQVFDRYRQRCQWYEASNLRALVEGKRGVEDRLTEALALYLFDRGLNPLVRPLIGQLLPDLLDTTSKFSFYVEAKQYSDAKRRPYLAAGARQIWDMLLGQLRGTPLEVREAFYVVFRLGGPRYVLPERLTVDGFIVFPILIDIAPSNVRGSRSAATVVIEAAEWLPETNPRMDSPSERPLRSKPRADR